MVEMKKSEYGVCKMQLYGRGETRQVKTISNLLVKVKKVKCVSFRKYSACDILEMMGEVNVVSDNCTSERFIKQNQKVKFDVH